MSTKNLQSPHYEKIGNAGAMYGAASQKTIGDNVREHRERKGWSVARLAREVGVALNTIQAIEGNRTQKSKYLPDIARKLGVQLHQIDPSQSVSLSQPTIPADELSVGRDLPVYGTTEAGDGVMVMSAEPVEIEDRPASLAKVRGAYGVIVTGDSMAPVVRAGDVVVVHPHRAPRPGDLCVFRSHEHGEFRSLLKEFVSLTSEQWRVRRYQPEEKVIHLPRKAWPECHVVVTIHRR